MSSLSFLSRRRSFAPSTGDSVTSVSPSDHPRQSLSQSHIPSRPDPAQSTSTPNQESSEADSTLSRTPSKSEQLIKRVSTLFSGRKRIKPFTGTLAPISSGSFSRSGKKKKGEASASSHAGSPSPFGSSLSRTSTNTTCDSEDDIRRPSGLGRSVSFSSHRSLPEDAPGGVVAPLHSIDDVVGVGRLEGGATTVRAFSLTATYQKSRAVSSPNLLGSSVLKMEGKSSQVSRNASLPPLSVLVKTSSLLANTSSHNNLDKPLPLSPPLPPTPTRRNTPDMPIEVWSLVLASLPRHEIARIAVLSKDLSQAVRRTLYGRLGDIGTLKLDAFQKLTRLLVSRSDLTDIVHTFVCRQWPWPSSSNPSAGALDRQNLDLIASSMTAFTLAFQRMHHLTTLVLPSFDLPLLRHHSAFGLKSLTFLNKTMETEDLVEMFNWLDGQINITSLMFPNLLDAPPIKPYGNIIVPLTIPIEEVESGMPLPTPHSFRHEEGQTSSASPTQLTTSPTLLPGLKSIQAPPAIVLLLCAPLSSSLKFHDHRQRYQEHNHISSTVFGLTTPHSSSPLTHRRPLERVLLNINCTLYMGLRPAAIMSALQGPNDGCRRSCPSGLDGVPRTSCGGLRSLGLRFGPVVDRRTVEKVLAAAGTTLGGGVSERRNRFEGESERRESAVGNDCSGGLESLEVELTSIDVGLDITVEETTYKTINAILPRYHNLRTLCLCSTIVPNPNPPPNPRRSSVPPAPLALTRTTITSTSPPLSVPPPIIVPERPHTPNNDTNDTITLPPSPGTAPPSPLDIRLFPVPPQGLPPLTPSSRYTISSLNSNRTSFPGSSPGQSPGIAELARSRFGMETGADGGDTELSTSEQAHLKNWLRQCPTLREVGFLSGARWTKGSSR